MSQGIREVFLDNGLKVILKEVHTAPLVSVWTWYRVGSRNEAEGRTGISHWVEHMIFKGTKQFPKGSIMHLVDRHGGHVNAMTSHDFTAYYITLPSDQIELALRIEADQMHAALFDPQEVEAERSVVIAEREEAENDPDYILAEEVAAAAFRVHPYHHQTIGWKTDLTRITRDELYNHYRQYYVPNNAVLVIVGDIESDLCLALVERLFGHIPTNTRPPQGVPEEPPQLGERRVIVHMPGSAPSLRIGYHTPPASHPDYLPLAVLDGILSGGKAVFSFGDSQARSARLYRALVETQLASSVGSHYSPSLDPFLLFLGATVREGREPGAVEEALLAEIDKLCQEPVTERELAVAIRQIQAQSAYASESVSGQALTIGLLEMVDSYTKMDRLPQELAAVTPDDVLRVARKYLVEDNRVVGWFLPSNGNGGEARQEARPESARNAPGQGMLAFFSKPRSLPVTPETVARHQLDNGAIILVKENPASASVSIAGRLKAGSACESDATAGLAHLTASMLRRGTRKHTFQEINVALDEVGASLSFSAEADGVSFGGRALASDFELLVNLLGEILMEPTFPEIELEKLRGQILTHLGVLDTDTTYRAECALMASLYPPGHPYARPIMGTRETVQALTRRDLAEFYSTHYHPQTLIMAVVGAIQPGPVMDKLEAVLGRWNPAQDYEPCPIPHAETPPTIVTQRVELPAKAQVDLIWGVVSMSRTSPDYYPAMMANLILGRLGLMGRLGEKVRDQLGLAYYVGSSLDVGLGPQPWSIMAGIHPTNIERTLSALLEEVQRLRETLVRDEELEEAQAYLIGSLPLHLETNEGIAHVLLDIEDYGLGLDYLQRYPNIVTGISKEELQRVARKYLTLDRYALAMAGTFA